MKKLVALSLILASTMTGPALLTTPATAAAICSGIFWPDPSRVSQSTFNQRYVSALREIGVNTDSVEKWGSCIKAYVTLPNGSIVMQYFDPYTLERVV